MIKLKDMLNVDITLGKVYTDKDRPPFQVKKKVLMKDLIVSYLKNFLNIRTKYSNFFIDTNQKQMCPL